MSKALRNLRDRGTNYLSKGDVWDNEDAQGRWPELYSFLALCQDGDVKREPSRITLYCQQGALFACVRCSTEDQIFHARLEHDEHPLDALETMLRKDKAEWRKMTSNGRK